ncbi:MAG: DUF5050 domain-containing protein [Ruminococcaceae bacterium]|nr:DUF5050 domain-containing protein [Oscillospiraceae bacterium]
MKRVIKILAAVSAVLLLGGCGSENEQPSEISEISDISGISDSVQEEISSTDESDKTDSSSSTVGGDISSIWDIPEKEEAPTEFEPFAGLPKADDPLNTVNSKDFRPSLLCYGGGNTFFMWNGTVYKHNGETTEALFEKNAYDLNYYDGMLYFIENDSYDLSNTKTHIEGLLYRYDLNSGAMEALTDHPVSLPVVSGGGIFFTHYATTEAPKPPTGIYRVGEDGTYERLYSGMKHIEYGEYRLKYDWSDEEKVCFSRDDTGLLLENVHPYWDCIVGDYYYYRSNDDRSLNRLSVLTGETATLKPTDESGFFCIDYTVLNGVIYLIGNQSELLRYNFETGDYTEIDYKHVFRYIYADENNIYGVACDREENSISHTFHFIKLSIDGDTVKDEILA